MGELKIYQPTKGMSAADRTVDGYRAVIKEWAHSLEDLFAPFYTITEFSSGVGVNFSPIDPTINNIEHQITIPDVNTIRYWAMTAADGNTGRVCSVSPANDPKLYVWTADDGFGFGIGDVPLYMGVMNTIDYDDNEQYIAFVNNSTAENVGGSFMITKSNGTEASGFSTSSVSYRGSANYCVKPHTCNEHRLINNHLYSLDGGLNLPEYRTMFTINDEKYFSVYDNTVFKF